MKEVLPSVNLSIACWTSSSVRVSTEDVASSSIRNGASFIIPRAIVNNCFWPAEMLSLSVITASSPPGRVFTNLSIPTVFNASQICSSVTFSLLYLILSLIVPLNNQVSCKTIMNISCIFSRDSSFIEVSSIVISPSEIL